MLGGLAILPAVFAMGVEPASGPSLLFITLPGVFAAMPGGAVVGGFLRRALYRGFSLRDRSDGSARGRRQALLALESRKSARHSGPDPTRRSTPFDGELGLSPMERSDLGLDHAADRVRSNTRGARVVRRTRQSARRDQSRELDGHRFFVDFLDPMVIPAAIIVILVYGWWPQ